MINLIVKCSSNQEKNAFISRFHSALTGSAAYVDSQITLLDADDDSLSLIIGSSNNGNLTMTVKAGDLAINFDLLASFNKKHDEDTEAHISLDITLTPAPSLSLHLVSAYVESLTNIGYDNIHVITESGQDYVLSKLLNPSYVFDNLYWQEWFSSLWREQTNQKKNPDCYVKKQYYYDTDGNEYYYSKDSFTRYYTRDEG